MAKERQGTQTEWFDSLSEPVRRGAHDLSPQHINEHAFTLPDALLVLDEISNGGWAVLGGDFYRRASAERWAPTYENWIVQRQSDEELSSYIARSIEDARAKISSVQTRSPELVRADHLRVVLVCSRPQSARGEP